MLLAAVGFVLAMSGVLGDHLGTQTIPVTYAVIELLGNSFSIFVVIIIAFIAGEMVWREYYTVFCMWHLYSWVSSSEY